jgi:hypothetical protein
LENKDLIRKHLEAVKDQSILTIGETETFSHMCGIINFFQEDNHLRFKINLDAAQHAGLKLSSQILMSAEIVEGCQ